MEYEDLRKEEEIAAERLGKRLNDGQKRKLLTLGLQGFLESEMPGGPKPNKRARIKTKPERGLEPKVIIGDVLDPPGWYRWNNLPVLVDKDARTFRTPEPVHSSSDYPNRTT